MLSTPVREAVPGGPSAPHRDELNFVKLGAVGAILLGVSSFVFFALAGATSKHNSPSEIAQFLTDMAGKPGLAVIWAWAQAWLGILTVPLYLGLYLSLRRFSQSYMLLALVTGVMWGIALILVTPSLFALVYYLAPAWAHEADVASRVGLLNMATTMMWGIVTQISIVFFLRAISIIAASRAMLIRGGRQWTLLGWLGIAFGIEHLLGGVLHQTVIQGGVNTLLGTVGGVMLIVWLVGAGVGLWRLPREAPEQVLVRGG